MNGIALHTTTIRLTSQFSNTVNPGLITTKRLLNWGYHLSIRVSLFWEYLPPLIWKKQELSIWGRRGSPLGNQRIFPWGSPSPPRAWSTALRYRRCPPRRRRSRRRSSPRWTCWTRTRGTWDRKRNCGMVKSAVHISYNRTIKKKIYVYIYICIYMYIYIYICKNPYPIPIGCQCIALHGCFSKVESSHPLDHGSRALELTFVG